VPNTALSATSTISATPTGTYHSDQGRLARAKTQARARRWRNRMIRLLADVNDGRGVHGPLELAELVLQAADRFATAQLELDQLRERAGSSRSLSSFRRG
jgi:hypothetical protein